MLVPGRCVETVKFPYRPNEPVFRYRGQPSFGRSVSIAQSGNYCNLARAADIHPCLHCKYRDQGESRSWGPQIEFDRRGGRWNKCRHSHNSAVLSYRYIGKTVSHLVFRRLFRVIFKAGGLTILALV